MPDQSLTANITGGTESTQEIPFSDLLQALIDAGVSNNNLAALLAVVGVDPHVAGVIWNNGGVLTASAG